MITWIDTETYNVRPISVGTDAYAETVEVMIVSYAIGDSPPLVWDRTAQPVVPQTLRAALQARVFAAHNARFDRLVLRHALGIDIPADQWRCTAAQARAHGFPGGLGQLCEILALDEGDAKIAEGKKLIQRFCKPAPSNHLADRYTSETHPDEWARFVEYARQDIASMREVSRRLPSWNYRVR